MSSIEYGLLAKSQIAISQPRSVEVDRPIYEVMDIVNIVNLCFKFARGNVDAQNAMLAHIVRKNRDRFTLKVMADSIKPSEDAAYFTYTSPHLPVGLHSGQPPNGMSVREMTDEEVGKTFKSLNDYLYYNPQHAIRDSIAIISKLVAADFRWLPRVRYAQEKDTLTKPYYSNVIRYAIFQEKPDRPEYRDIFTKVGEGIFENTRVHQRMHEIIEHYRATNKEDRDRLDAVLAGTALEPRLTGAYVPEKLNPGDFI